MNKLKTHRKIGIGIALAGFFIAGASLAIPAIASYLFIAGVVLIIVGIFVFQPDFAL